MCLGILRHASALDSVASLPLISCLNTCTIPCWRRGVTTYGTLHQQARQTTTALFSCARLVCDTGESFGPLVLAFPRHASRLQPGCIKPSFFLTTWHHALMLTKPSILCTARFSIPAARYLGAYNKPTFPAYLALCYDTSKACRPCARRASALLRQTSASSRAELATYLSPTT